MMNDCNSQKTNISKFIELSTELVLMKKEGYFLSNLTYFRFIWYHSWSDHPGLGEGLVDEALGM